MASAIPLAPTPAQIANRQLAASGNPPASANSSSATYGGTGVSTTADYNDQAASELAGYLGGGTVTPSESDYERTLLGQYTANSQATEQAYQNEYQGLQASYAAQMEQLNREINNNTNTDSENNMGVNASLLAFDKNLGASRQAQLLGSEAAAETAANTAETTALSGLSQNYNTNLTASRANMAAALESAATLQTPEEANQLAQQKAQQAAIVQLQTEAPDAGIESTDDFNTAITKFKNSTYYKANIGQATQTVKELVAQTQQAGAAAAASAASAAQTRVLTSLMQNGGGNDAEILQGLQSGKYSISDLPNLINPSVDPQGVKRITSEFLAGGGNAVANEASVAATKANAANLGSGGYTGLSTGATNVFGNFLGGAFGANPLAPPTRSLSTGAAGFVTMTGPKGTYTVPASQVATMQNNGYTITQ